MSELAASHPGLDTRRPFTRADAVAAGVPPKVLRTSRFRRLFRGVYVSADVTVTDLIRSAGALALHPPTAYASHTSAARAYGLPIPDDSLEHVSVGDPGDRRPRQGIVTHAAPRGARARVHRGVRVSPPMQTFVELASILGLVDLVVFGDALVRMFDITAAELVHHCDESTYPNSRRARAAARYVRDRVESPMESRLRMLLVLAGLPEPAVNYEIGRTARGRRYRLDLAYPAARVAVEYDGRQHAESTAQWQHDLERREDLDDHGWKLIVVTAEDLRRAPELVLQRVRAALATRRALGSPGRLSDAWRAHFPVR